MGEFSQIIGEFANLRRREVAGDKTAAYTWRRREEDLGAQVDRDYIDEVIALEDRFELEAP